MRAPGRQAGRAFSFPAHAQRRGRAAHRSAGRRHRAGFGCPRLRGTEVAAPGPSLRRHALRRSVSRNETVGHRHVAPGRRQERARPALGQRARAGLAGAGRRGGQPERISDRVDARTGLATPGPDPCDPLSHALCCHRRAASEGCGTGGRRRPCPTAGVLRAARGEEGCPGLRHRAQRARPTAARRAGAGVRRQADSDVDSRSRPRTPGGARPTVAGPHLLRVRPRPTRGLRAAEAAGDTDRNPLARGQLSQHGVRVPGAGHPVHRKQSRRHPGARRARGSSPCPLRAHGRGPGGCAETRALGSGRLAAGSSRLRRGHLAGALGRHPCDAGPEAGAPSRAIPRGRRRRRSRIGSAHSRAAWRL